MSTSYLCLGSAIALAVAAPALATTAVAAGQSPAAKAPPATAQAPKAMTRAQFLANVQTRFNAVDTNHDGFLDSSEVAAAQQKELQQARAVAQQRMEGEFTKLDTNRDGQLSKAEFLAAAPQVQSQETAQQIIGTIDSSKDGKLSLPEYQARPLANFNRLDSNHDGTVTQQEIAAAAKAPKKR